MAWTEQDYQEIVARLMAGSIGVNEVPNAEDLDNISSLPAYQPANGTEVPTVVKASLELLVAPALDAADKANEAADKAESNATAAQTAANTANEKAELAAQAASDVNAAKEGAETAAQSANTAASNANEKAVLADTAAANANDTAEHPTYIGQDHYVYKWNKTAQAYDKTDIYTKGDAFSIKKVYASVANMEADKSNPDITEGDFVLVNTGDVEDPDNAKLYVKADGDFEFLVDMSGAIGFTGKTPQFSIGTISTLEAGSTATATISEDGVDSDGNPKYKINFAIPRGNPGAPFRIAGEYATLEALKSAVPDGSAVDGFMAVGTEAPYDYYAWVNGDWVNQGKIAGGGSGNVVVIPAAAMSLSVQATSDEILAAFGGIDKYKDLFEKLSTNNCLVQIGEPSLGSLRHIYTLVEYTVKFASNKQWGALGFNIYNEEQQLRRLHFYLENNGTTARCGEASTFQLVRDTDVLTKDNTTAYTPTQNYHPATKKYADASSLYKVYNLGLNVIDRTGVLLLWEAEKDEYNATVYRGIMMGSLCTIPLNGITQAGSIPLVSMSASFRKVGDNNETDFMYARGSSSIRVAPATVIYNNKDYTALQIEVSGEADIMNFVGYFDRPPLLTWVPYLEETGSGTVILNEEINSNIDVFAVKELVGSSDVLTKNNTSAYTPTQHYHPATKAYADNIGYGRTISINTTADKFLNTANLSGVDAEQRVIDLFGSLDNFKNVVANILANHVRYYFHFGDNPNNDCVELGCVNAWRANNKSSHELHFIITYHDENNLYTNRISIVVNNDTAASKVIIASLVRSDNLTTITKKTAAEYEALGSKDANTVYCVTD